MKRLLMIAAVLVIPASAWAQVPPPPPTPRPAPVPPSPVAAPVAPAPVIAGFPGGLLGDFDQSSAREAMERARIAMEDSRLDLVSM